MFFKRIHFIIAALLFFFTFISSNYLRANDLSMVVIDAKNGQEVFSKNSVKRRPPASLTKMMTLYLTFYAVENTGKLKLDQRVRISKKASGEPPSRLGLKAGNTETIRNLIRSAALKSANDSATALAEAISGSELKFAEYMTRSAKLMGMENTRFKNAHGLTEKGHYSTASDMAILARRLYTDFPDYYHLFGKNFTYVRDLKIKNTNWKFLKSYRGADGIKTGYTNAAGFNLAASAERGSERVIGVILGAKGSGERTKRMIEMLNIGFSNLENYPYKDPLSPINLDNLLNSGSLGVLVAAHIPPPRPNLNFSIDSVDFSAISNVSKIDRPQIFLIPKSFSPDTEITNEIESSFKVYSQKRDHFIQVGFYYTKSNAKGDITKVILSSIDTLKESQTNIVPVIRQKEKGYSLEFDGLTSAQALKSCARIRVNKINCTVSFR